MSQYRGLLISDSPVENPAEDLLFRERRNLFQRLERLAEELVSPLICDAPVPSLTVAVHGPWGSGKSTCLSMIEALARNHLDEAQSARFTTTRFYAPLHQALSTNVRASLMFEILRSLDAQSELRAIIEDHLDLHAPLATLTKADKHFETKRDMRLRRALEELQKTQFHVEMLVETFIATSLAKPEETRAHLVLVDELDRCSLAFTADVVGALHYWTRFRNMFFVLAVDRPHLEASLDKYLQASRYEGHALEKYVQYSLELPPAFVGMESRFRFMARLLRQLGLDELAQGAEGPRHWAKALTQLMEAGETQPHGSLIDPLLRLDQANETPRGVKRILNRLLMDVDAMRVYDESALKESVIFAVWPAFASSYLDLGVKGRVGDNLRALEAIGRKVRSEVDLEAPEGRAIAADMVAMLARQRRVDIPDEGPELVMYLGLDPLLFTEREGSLWRPDNPDVVADTSGTPGEVAPPPSPGELDARSRVLGLYYELQNAARAQGPGAAIPIARELLRVAEGSLEELSEATADVIGNVAIVAERATATALAERLFELALRLDEGHPNNLQGYVSLILDGRLERLYPRAGLLLAKLRTEPRARQVRPIRRLALEIQYADVTGQPLDYEPAVRDALGRFKQDAETDVVEVVALMGLLQKIAWYDEGPEVARFQFESRPSNEERYVVLLSLGELLYSSDESRHEWEAVEILQDLLISGLVCQPFSAERLPRVLAELGYLLTKHGRHETGGGLLRRALQKAPADHSIRRMYAGFLAEKAARHDLAAQVLRGSTVEEEVVVPDESPLPTIEWHGERWWVEGWDTGLPPCAEADLLR